MEYYSALKKNEIMTFSGKWMELKNIMLSEVSKSQKNQRPNVFSDMWMLIYNKGAGALENSYFRLGRGE